MVIKVNTEPIPEQREDLFELGGTMYSIPVEVPGNVSLEAMERFRRGGDGLATPWLMEELIGSEGYKALRECKTLRKEDLVAIQEVIRLKVFGPQEQEGKG